MIPKVIHYCWFGRNPKPKIVKKCIASWKKYCPDYKIIEWNESNYDVDKCLYTKQAYTYKKWAFVSDYARLDIIYNCGGIYLDTDVELVQNLDKLLSFDCFISADSSGINTGLGFGATRQHPTIEAMLELYNGKGFATNAEKMDLTPCTVINSKWAVENGYKIGDKNIIHIKNTAVLPPEYFSPLDSMSQLHMTDNTYGIHWGCRSWESGLTKIKAVIRIKLGNEVVNKIKQIYKKSKGERKSGA